MRRSRAPIRQGPAGAPRGRLVGRSLAPEHIPAGLLERVTLRQIVVELRRRARPVAVALAGRDHVLAIGVAALLLVASVLSVAPGTSAGATGNVYGPTNLSALADPRLAIGGGYVEPSAGLAAGLGSVGADLAGTLGDGPAADVAGTLPGPVAGSVLGTGSTVGTSGLAGDAADQVAASDPAATTDPAVGTGDAAGSGPAGSGAAGGTGDATSPAPSGAYLADGTLLKPVAVDTSVPDAKDRLTTYHVRAGDTLTGIASQFGVSMMTLWWANDLASKDALHIGQALRHPARRRPRRHRQGGRHARRARQGDRRRARPDRALQRARDERAHRRPDAHRARRQGRRDPDPDARPTGVRLEHERGGIGRQLRRQSGSSGGASAKPPVHYAGGTFAWPVPGGYISQYFHYGHEALDIAADMGSRVDAVAAGTIIFAALETTAADTRSGSPTAPTCTPPPTTCRL